MSIRSCDDKTIELGINIHFYRQRFIENDKNNDYRLKFRAYYISAFIKSLEKAADTMPLSYFSGLVSLCAINILQCGKTTESYSPIEGKLRYLRPIDIHCAITALNRLISDNKNQLSDKSIKEIKEYTDKLVLFTLLPEIGYCKAEPVYSLLTEIKQLYNRLVMQGCPADEYVLFGENIYDYLNETIESIISKESIKDNPFIQGAAMRMIAWSGRKNITDQVYNIFTECYEKYRCDSVKYYKETGNKNDELLRCNLVAVKKLSQKLEQYFGIYKVNTEALHYYR